MRDKYNNIIIIFSSGLDRLHVASAGTARRAQYPARSAIAIGPVVGETCGRTRSRSGGGGGHQWRRVVAISGGEWRGPVGDTRRDGYTVLGATTNVYCYHIATCGNIIVHASDVKNDNNNNIIIVCKAGERTGMTTILLSHCTGG